MSTLHVEGIGPVDFTNDDGGYWRVETKLGGLDIDVTFDTDGPDMTVEMLACISPFLSDIESLDSTARQALSSEFLGSEESDGGMYLQHHVEELEAEERTKCFGTTDRTLGIDHLLSSLRLKRLGLYPNDDESVVVLDYAIGEDITDYILAVKFTPDGNVLGVSMES